MMLNKINSIKNEILLSLVIFMFSVFINRTITLDTHSLGKNLDIYSKIFPNNLNILQPHRVLLPFLGKVLHLNIQILNLFFYLLFIFYLLTYLKKVDKNNKAIFFVLALSTTMVTQFHLNFGGYPDILSYLLLLLTYINREKKYFPYLLFFLALLTKETVIFTLPFFFFLSNVSKLKFIISTVTYLPIYFYLSVGDYDYRFYLDPLKNDLFYWIKLNTDNLLLGYFSSIKFLWIIVIYFCLRNFNKKSIPIYLLFIGILFQFLFGGDTTRFVSFMFLGLVYIYEHSKFKFSNTTFIFITFLNIITPKYYVFAKGSSVNNLLLINSNRIEIFDVNIYFQYITFLITKIFT